MVCFMRKDACGNGDSFIESRVFGFGFFCGQTRKDSRMSGDVSCGRMRAQTVIVLLKVGSSDLAFFAGKRERIRA